MCSFAWADAEVRPEERRFVARLMARLELDADERRQVEAWLASPPEGVDPDLVPREHRTRFLHAVESVIAVDGEIAAEEKRRLLELGRRLR